MGMELVALFLALFRRPLIVIIGVVLLIAFVRDNPWTAALTIGASVAVLAIAAHFNTRPDSD